MSRGITRQQKESVALLSVGTFLEYFDLMLYIHMAVLLNELFFPQNNPLTAQLFAAFTFCSTFLLRPIGGLLIGWIGDQVGRKTTIILTTSIMALSCLTMANLGTYAQIGITASIAVIACRALQGVSSLGEIVGAKLYLIETLKRPYSFMCAVAIGIGSQLGGLFALVIASIALSVHFNWRIAFWIGAVIALVGIFARLKLRETPEFVDFKRRMKIKMEMNQQDSEVIKNSPMYKEAVDKRVVLAYFFINLIPGAAFYITYVYIGDVMKKSLGFSASDVINQNLRLNAIVVIGAIITMLLTRKHHPIKIAKVYAALFLMFLPFLPYCLGKAKDLYSLSFLQFASYIPELCIFGMCPVFYKHLPVARRFTIIATIYGAAAAFIRITVSFGLIPLAKYFGHYSLWIIYVPVCLCFIYGVKYLEKLERRKGQYLNYPDEDKSDGHGLFEEKDYNYDFIDKEAYQGHNLSCKYAKDLLYVISRRAKQENKLINVRFIEKAIIFAKKWHDGQFRATGEPFYSHPLAVASIVAKYIVKTDIIIATILHDIVEDTPCSVDLIAREFNPHVAQIVDNLTKIRFESGKKVKLGLPEMIEKMYQANDNEALLIKQLDRLHNISTINIKSREKQIETAIETNNCLVTMTDYTADKLGIESKLCLENRLFKYCRDILISK